MWHPRCVPAVLCALLVVACDRDGASTEARPVAAETLAPAPRRAASAQAAPLAPLEEAELRAVLEQWLRAQNEGDLEAYSALYAERFFGVKRVASRTYSFERDAWLADRRRMFRRAMVVEAEAPEFAAGTTSATVRFVQKWSSGTFSDEGPKQLVIVRQRGELRIAREEMIASAVRAQVVDTTPLEGAVFSHVLDLGDRSYLVLHDRADAAWSRGAPRLLVRGHPSAASKAATAALPPSLSAWRGRQVHLAGARSTCEGQIDQVLVVRVVNPHFGNLAQWNGENDEPRASDPSVARDVWSLSGRGFVVGRVTAGCAGSWAYAGPEAPTVLHAVAGAADARLMTLARRRFRALPAYRTQQREARAAGQTGAWAEPILEAWANAAGEAQVVTVHAYSGGCGADFEGMLWAAFLVRGDDLVALSDESTPDYVSPVSVADVDGDGHFEVIGQSLMGDRRLMRGSPVLRETRGLSYADLDCPC